MTEEVKDTTVKAVTGTIEKVADAENKVTFKVKASRFAHKAGLKVKIASPYLIIGAGTAGLVATTYLAIQSKDKFDQLKDEHDTLHQQYVDEMNDEEHPMDNAELIQALDVHFQKEIIKTFALPALVGLASIASIGFGLKGFHNRTTALSTALAGATAELAARHDKMVETYGEEETAKFEDGLEYEEREDKDGVKADVKVGGDKPAPFGEWFDYSTEYAADDLAYNKSYVQSINERMQNKQFRNGYILLNDLRDELGFDRTRTGSYMGWGPNDNLDVEVRPICELDEETQEFKTRQFVVWTQPKSIYDMVDYTQPNGFGL